MATFGPRIAHVAPEGFRQGLNCVKTGDFGPLWAFFVAFLQKSKFRLIQETSTILRVFAFLLQA